MLGCHLGKLFSDSADLLAQEMAPFKGACFSGRLRERVVALSVVGDNKWLSLV